ncbi:SPW repeat protein [Streptomyces xiamenensis]
MADVSHHRGTDVSHRRDTSMADHPDAREMRERYSRVTGGATVPLLDAPVFLAGLYLAISAWLVPTFFDAQPRLGIHNLILGIAVAVLALGFALAPERMHGMGLALCVIGAWSIVAIWTVGSGASGGIILSQIIVGGVIFLLGLAATGAALAMRRKSRTHNERVTT